MFSVKNYRNNGSSKKMQEHLVTLCYIMHIKNQNIKEPILLSVDSNKLLLNIVLVTDVLKVFNCFCRLHKECKITNEYM
jgi:hypothetical protein